MMGRWWFGRLIWQGCRLMILLVLVLVLSWWLRPSVDEPMTAPAPVQVIVSAVDQATREPITADYFLYRQMLDTDLKVIDSFVLACELVERCVLEDVPLAGAGYEWRVRVEAAGYVAQTVYITDGQDGDFVVEMIEGGEA